MDVKRTVKKLLWPGRGYIRIVGNGKDQRRTYVINKHIDGKKFHVSTRRDTPAEAEAEYQRFAQAPRGYSPAGDAPKAQPAADPVWLTADLIEKQLHYSAHPDPQERRRPNSKGWLYKKRVYLSWWAEELRGVNLRSIDLKEHVYPALKGMGGRAHPSPYSRTSSRGCTTRSTGRLSSAATSLDASISTSTFRRPRRSSRASGSGSRARVTEPP